MLSQVSEERLRWYVEMIAFPRHYEVERAANERARDLLLCTLHGFGYSPVLQGAYHIIVATSEGNGPFLLLGAHYDSVPGNRATPIVFASSTFHTTPAHGALHRFGWNVSPGCALHRGRRPSRSGRREA
jgi:hypothetical protein